MMAKSSNTHLKTRRYGACCCSAELASPKAMRSTGSIDLEDDTALKLLLAAWRSDPNEPALSRAAHREWGSPLAMGDLP